MKVSVAQFGRSKGARISHLAMFAALGVGLFSAGTSFAQADKPDAAQKTSEAKKADAKDDGAVVIVTGVMAKTKAKKANVSYSVLTEEDMSKFTPISADDMLRDLPGTIVETNDGVARNEVFTRGMAAGTGSNTSGYFWTTILEDGLPVVPFKFSGFQDGYFYRADISTSRVESVRGGSSATGVTSSVGATFNYIQGKIRPGASIQTRIGFEGEDLHLSWKQIDGYYGWLNKAGDFGYSVNGFYRKSNGQVNPGYDLNSGGQFKINLFKGYNTASGGSGKITATYKHLDDSNAELTAFNQPVYGNTNDPVDLPGIGRDVNFFLHGGEAMMPDYVDSGSHRIDPRKGFRYTQDAVTLKWEYDTGAHWNYSVTGRMQSNGYDGNGYKANAVVSLTASAAEREAFGLNINNLDRTPGYYEFYDSTNTLVAKVANNVNGSQLGVDYRTGAACPKVTSTTFSTTAGAASLCVVYNALPNRNLDMRGGTVVGSISPFPTATVPLTGGNQDLVMTTRIEDSHKQSRDTLVNAVANYTGDTITMNFGIYLAHGRQQYFQWGDGTGISAYADGQIQNLNVQYVTNTGTRYQLTNEGGWGAYGPSLFTTIFQYAAIQETSPYAGIAWSPNEHWDFNASVKRSMYTAKTDSYTFDTRNSGAASLTNGGLDGNPLTVYDNVYTVQTPAKNISVTRHSAVTDWSASVGYNFSPTQKLWYRYTTAYQPAAGVVQRYSTVAALSKPLGPTASMKGHEVGWDYKFGNIGGEVVWFYSDWGLNDYPTATDVDNVSTYLLPSNFNKYFTRGVEASAKWRITRNLRWDSSVTFNNSKNLAIYTWLNTGANGQGAADDVLRIDSGIMPRSPRWTVSNTLSYQYHDLGFNLRHRWMDKRKIATDPLDLRYLPAQDNLDASVMYTGFKDTRVSLDIRNVLNGTYVSATSSAFALPSGVQATDIYSQLPNSLYFIRRNSPRSVWLTMKHDF